MSKQETTKTKVGWFVEVDGKRYGDWITYTEKLDPESLAKLFKMLLPSDLSFLEGKAYELKAGEYERR